MVERKSKKMSMLMFLFAIFILLSVITASWLYKMYTEQTAYSESSTLATIECSKYYFSIEPESVLYEDNTLYFEVKNTLGANLEDLIVKSYSEEKTVHINLDQGSTQPVSIPIDVVEWVLVFPAGCEGVNFKNLSFETNS